MTYKTIRASQLNAGDWLAYDNPRYNRRIVSVQSKREGQLIVRYDFGKGGEAATALFHPNEFVQVL